MSIMLIATGITHFTSTETMMEMIPEILPYKREIVYLTGIIEILAVFGLVIPQTSRLTALMLIIFYFSILPANVIGSIKQVNLGGMDYGINYLFFRIPLQIFFIFWAYYFGIKINRQATSVPPE